jgi:hypothetical protein
MQESTEDLNELGQKDMCVCVCVYIYMSYDIAKSNRQIEVKHSSSSNTCVKKTPP